MLKLSHAPLLKFTRSDRGFTIVEALVALALVSCTLMAIGSVLATTTLGVRSLEQHLRLVQIARSVVAGVPLDNPLAFRSLSGETEGFRWKIVASPFLAEPQKQASESSWVPMKLSIEVRSPAGASFQLETIRLQRGVTN